MNLSTPINQRVYGLDLAKGLALAGILLANMFTSFSLYWGQPLLDPSTITGSIDQFIYLFYTSTIEGKFYPLFATIFGIGLSILSQRGMGYLRIRLALLALIGATHTGLFYYGDIILTYALTALVLTLIPWNRVWLKISLPVSFILFCISQYAPDTSALPDLSDLGDRLAFQGLVLTSTIVAFPLQAIIVAPFILMGVWIYQRDLLASPPPLSILAVAIMLLFSLGFLEGAYALKGHHHELVSGLSNTLGALAGPLMVLVAPAFTPHRILEPIAILGRSSLTGYLLQSVYVWVIAPFYQGLHLHALGLFLLALGGWLISLLILNIFDRFGRQGPVDQILRASVLHLTSRQLRIKAS